jgi:plasmid stabilization system protein ParE
MIFSFHPEAQQEFDQAVTYYDTCQPGLGTEFAEEVYAAILRIIQYPEAGTRSSVNTRRCLMNRFPYGVIYQVKAEAIRIVAVANLRRRPGYWMERTREGP